MTNLNISAENQRYNLKGTSFFETTDGTQYSINREDSLELVSLLLEALGMDTNERDELYFQLEDKIATRIA